MTGLSALLDRKAGLVAMALMVLSALLDLKVRRVQSDLLVRAASLANPEKMDCPARAVNPELVARKGRSALLGLLGQRAIPARRDRAEKLVLSARKAKSARRA